MISARLTSPSPSTEVSYVTGQTPTPDADDENDEPEAEPNESRPHAQVSKHSLVSHWSKALSFGKAFNDVIYRVQKSCYQANIVTDYVLRSISCFWILPTSETAGGTSAGDLSVKPKDMSAHENARCRHWRGKGIMARVPIQKGSKYYRKRQRVTIGKV